MESMHRYIRSMFYIYIFRCPRKTYKITYQGYKQIIGTDLQFSLELTKYLLLETSHKYFMLGVIKTDPLGETFGKFFQISGKTYFINVDQSLETVCISKIKLLLQLDMNVVKFNGVSGYSCENGAIKYQRKIIRYFIIYLN